MSAEQNFPRQWGGLNLKELHITRDDLKELNFSACEIASITDEDLEDMNATIRDNLGMFVLPVEIEKQVYDRLG